MPQEDTQEVRRPPRYRWLKRLLLAGGLVLLGVLGVRVLAGQMASSRLGQIRAEFAVRLAATDPRRSLFDSENAAVHLLAAAKSIDPVAGLPFELEDAYYYEELRTDAPDLVDQLLQANAPALQALVAVHENPRADWSVAGPPGAFAHFRGQRQLAKLLVLDARVGIADGDPRRAATRIEDTLAVADRLLQAGDSVSALVAIAIAALPRRTAEQWLRADLPPPDAATQTQLRKMIADLLAQDAPREAFERALLSSALEAAGLLYWPSAIVAGPGGVTTMVPMPLNSAQSRLAWPLRPVFLADANHLLRQVSTLAPRLYQDPFDPGESISEEPPTLLGRLARLVWAPSLSAYARMLELFQKDLAGRRCLAVALACILYRGEHGQLPQTLADLVPVYLPEAPLDPFGDGSQELIYELADGQITIRPRTERVIVSTLPPERPPLPLPATIRHGIAAYRAGQTVGETP